LSTNPIQNGLATEELSLVERIESWFAEAEALNATGHPDLGIVRAVSATEVFLKQVFLSPYLRRRVLVGHGEFADLVADALLEGPRWRERIKPTLRLLWGIEVGAMPSWGGLNSAWTTRNKIVHSGEECDVTTAAAHIASCRTFAHALLHARAGARAAQAPTPLH
jgi:hypothetical protein